VVAAAHYKHDVENSLCIFSTGSHLHLGREMLLLLCASSHKFKLKVTCDSTITMLWNLDRRSSCQRKTKIRKSMSRWYQKRFLKLLDKYMAKHNDEALEGFTPTLKRAQLYYCLLL
jgi:hypothetical protein